MGDIFQSILVATDLFRSEVEIHNGIIAVAKKFHASLQMVYVVRFDELRIPVISFNPYGPSPGPPLVRGTAREKGLVAKGHEELKRFKAACEGASIKCSGEVLIGGAEAIWAQKARACDLLTIPPVERDFEDFRAWFSNIFWRIATRSKRPVLVFRRGPLPKEKVVLFHTGYINPALRAAKRAAVFCSVFGLPLVIYEYKSLLRNPHLDKECQAFFQQRKISATFKEESALEVLDREVNRPGSEPDSTSLFVFDSGFCKGFWLQKHRRLLDQVILNSKHSILLCP